MRVWVVGFGDTAALLVCPWDNPMMAAKIARLVVIRVAARCRLSRTLMARRWDATWGLNCNTGNLGHDWRPTTEGDVRRSFERPVYTSGASPHRKKDMARAAPLGASRRRVSGEPALDRGEPIQQAVDVLPEVKFELDECPASGAKRDGKVVIVE